MITYIVHAAISLMIVCAILILCIIQVAD